MENVKNKINAIYGMNNNTELLTDNLQEVKEKLQKLIERENITYIDTDEL